MQNRNKFVISILLIALLVVQSAPALAASAVEIDPAEPHEGSRVEFEASETIPFRYAITIPAGIDRLTQVYIHLVPGFRQTTSDMYGKKNALTLRAITLNIDFNFKAGVVGDEALSASGAFFIKDFYWEEGSEIYSGFYRSETYRQPHKIFEKIIDQTVEYLTEEGFIVDRRVLIDGFSTDGAFAQHFAVMSPEYVRAIVAGQCAGAIMLPFAQLDGYTLNYPLGIADYQQDYIDGGEWDEEAYRDIDQLIYIADVDQVCDGISDYYRVESNIAFTVKRFGVLVTQRLYRQVQYIRENGFDRVRFHVFQGNLSNTHAPLSSSIRYQFLLDAVNGILEHNTGKYNTPQDEAEQSLASVTVEAEGWQAELREYLTRLAEE